MKKNILGMTLAGVAAFTLANVQQADALTIKPSDWVTDNGTFGTITKKENNVINVKGAPLDVNAGMQYGPYTKVNKEKIADGINQDLYVEVDPANMKTGEGFAATVSLDDNDDATPGQITELMVNAQKVNDTTVRLTVGLDPDFSYDITEKGVYTFNWKMYKEQGKAYGKFTVSLWDEVLKSTKAIDFDVNNPTADGPVAEKAYQTRSVWLADVKVENGVNVYQELPPKPVVPEEKPEDDKKEENPKTSDNALVYVTMAALGLGAVTLTYKKVSENL